MEAQVETRNDLPISKFILAADTEQVYRMLDASLDGISRLNRVECVA
jgi:hypothetical protein